MTDAEKLSPLIYRYRLRSYLRQARLDAQLTQEQVADEMDWSLSKIIRIEKGEVGISTNDLKAVLEHYKIDDPDHVSELLAQAKAAKGRSWWSQYHKLISTQLIQFIEYESSASVIRNFEPQLVPGLLQTEDYARAALRQFANESLAEKLTEVRMTRQQILERAHPPQLFFIINEEVVRRGLGGAEVMRPQIEKLVKLSSHPTVTVEVIPLSANVHPGMHSPFVIDELPDLGDDVLYVENPRGSYIGEDKPDDVLYYRETFEELRKLALSPADSVIHLTEIAKRAD